MDEVKRLLEQFADRTLADVPRGDVDADVARGRRALRRVRTRRRSVAVLCLAAATVLMVSIGNPARWWPGHGAGVAADRPAPDAGPAGSPTRSPAGTLSPAPTLPAASYASSPSSVVLVANRRPWPGLYCRLVPAGWREQSVGAGLVVLAPQTRQVDRPGSQVTGTEPSTPGAEDGGGGGGTGALVLRTALVSEPIHGARSLRTAGRVVQLGRYAGGERGGQTRLGDRWLIVRLPPGDEGWTDGTVQRLITSCTLR